MNAYDHLARDPVMAALIARFGKIRRRPTRQEPYEALCEAVVYQQLSGKAAGTIHGRVVDRIGGGAFPPPERLLDATDEALRAAGLSRNKAAYLRDLARHALDGRLPTFEACKRLSDDELITRLTDIRGIGRWTVEMFLMFTLGRPDVLPVDDLGIRRGYQFACGHAEPPKPQALAALGERWAPHRTLAAFYLWRAADGAPGEHTV